MRSAGYIIDEKKKKTRGYLCYCYSLCLSSTASSTESRAGDAPALPTPTPLPLAPGWGEGIQAETTGARATLRAASGTRGRPRPVRLHRPRSKPRRAAPPAPSFGGRSPGSASLRHRATARSKGRAHATGTRAQLFTIADADSGRAPLCSTRTGVATRGRPNGAVPAPALTPSCKQR